MIRKKIIFIIVEGKSDQKALGIFFERFFNDKHVEIHIYHGDITSEKGVTAANILVRITRIVKEYASVYNLNSKDFAKIIHIIDMDGAFVDDTVVTDSIDVYDGPLETEEVEDALYFNQVIYGESYILTAYPHNIIARNKNKRMNINKISSLNTKIWNSIPYEVYYMSCNLDHVLYNKLNLTTKEKKEYSIAFEQKYADNLDEFVEFITKSNFSRCSDYKQSWNFIQKDENSLKRYTNLGLCFIDKISENN